MQKAKWLSEETLQIAVKRREAKSKEEKERYKHLIERDSALGLKTEVKNHREQTQLAVTLSEFVLSSRT